MYGPCSMLCKGSGKVRKNSKKPSPPPLLPPSPRPPQCPALAVAGDTGPGTSLVTARAQYTPSPLLLGITSCEKIFQIVFCLVTCDGSLILSLTM